MATKKFKIYNRQDFEKLLDDFTDSRKLTDDEQATSKELYQQYYDKTSEFNEISLNMNALIELIRSKFDEDLSTLESKLDLLQKYVEFIPLYEKRETLTDEEKEVYLNLRKDLAGKQEEVKEIISTFKSVKNLQDIIEEAKRLKDIENNDEFIEAIKEYVDDSEAEEYNQYLSQKEAQATIEREIEEITADIEKIESKTAINDENFKTFLEEQGFSSEDAEKLLRYTASDNFSISNKEYKQRKEHNKRDQVVKKGLIPTAVTCSGIGAVVSAIANSGESAISQFAKVFPVMGSKTATLTANTTLGILAGLALTPVVFWTKDKLTKLHYNVWYKNAKTNLSDYEANTKIKDLRITKLMEKIENTTHTILALNQGNWFTRKLKFIPKHILNAVNRNRVHHLEAYTQDLCKIYQSRSKAEQNTDSVKNLLNAVKDFIERTTFEIQLNTMLYRQDKSHKHNPLFEYIDTYETLQLKVNAIAERKKFKKLPKKTLDSKKEVGAEILNHGFNISLLSKTRERDAERKANENNVTNPNTSTDIVVEMAETPKTETPEIEIKPKKTSSNSKLNEIETTRRVALEKLNDSAFVEILIKKGFTKKDIRTLRTKLEEALDENKPSVVKSTSNAFAVYETVIAMINAEKAKNQSFITSTSDDIVTV